VEFAWAPPAPGSNLRGDDHFCLLVRLENGSDPSLIESGGWAPITARNNIALRNVNVRSPASDAVTSFYVVGSDDQDSLIVYPELVGGQVLLTLPVTALPWRDLRLIESFGRRRPAYGSGDQEDPLTEMTATLQGEEIRRRTDITGAGRLELRDGLATITLAPQSRLHIPFVRLAPRARMPASLRVRGASFSDKGRHVHVGQLSGGQRIGGISLELRPKSKTKSRK